ncbi:hypothetical protein PMAYCL1PPCAC_04588, partial [Pristionchus mayeri]
DEITALRSYCAITGEPLESDVFVEDFVKKMQQFIDITREIGAEMDEMCANIGRQQREQCNLETLLRSLVDNGREWITEAEERVSEVLREIASCSN